MPTCSKCRAAPALTYHAYCYACLRAARGQSPEPKYRRDSQNKALCSRCKTQPRRKYHNYCAACGGEAVKAAVSKHGSSWRYALARGSHRKVLARHLVANRIKRGKLIPKPCEICGAKAQAHHDHGYDAEHALDVRWLCPTHHRQLHRFQNIRNLLTVCGIV